MSTSVQSVGNLHQAATQLSPMAAATAPVTSPYPDVGRAVFQDPRTGQSVCCSPLDSRAATLLAPTVSRHALHDVMYPTAEKSWLPFSHIDPSMIYPNPLANGRTACYPYDLLPAQYPFYGESNYYGYGAMDLNGARRKNATRETTSTLKAWLYEHRKNPYPTKGEKIMLAIITKMTLTQVSTWFANARRRLKKEKKMTWSPRSGGCGSGGAAGEDCDDLELDDVGCDEKDDGIGSDLESSHNEQLSDTDDAHDGNRADWETRVSPRDAETTSIGSPSAEPNVSLGSNSGRDSFVKITQDSEEDSASRSSREHYSTVCHRRSPSPAPLAPSSVIRATCRPTSRSPPCEKVLPRQTEKPKIWSLAETALSKSPERSHRKSEHCRVTAGLHNRFSPYESHLNHPRLASHHPTSVHVQLDDGTSSRTTGIISPVISDCSRTFSHVGHGSHVFTGADAFSRLQHIKGNTVKTT